MSYLDTIIESKTTIEASSDVPVNQKLLLIELIEEKRIRIEAKADSFHYVYSDIVSSSDIFDFKTQLDELYMTAQAHAGCCVDIFVSFSKVTPTVELQNWLSSVIRMVNCIVTHYLQEVLNVEAIKQDNYAIERSRYKQVERLKVKASKAGRIMFNLYEERNTMEHQVKNDPNNPNKKIFVPPNYKRSLRQINKRLPEALLNFDEAYKEYYAS
jgi:hypothetical protein